MGGLACADSYGDFNILSGMCVLLCGLLVHIY